MSSVGGDRDARSVAMLLRYVGRLIDCDEPGGKNADMSVLDDGRPVVCELACYSLRLVCLIETHQAVSTYQRHLLGQLVRHYLDPVVGNLRATRELVLAVA